MESRRQTDCWSRANIDGVRPSPTGDRVFIPRRSLARPGVNQPSPSAASARRSLVEHYQTPAAILDFSWPTRRYVTQNGDATAVFLKPKARLAAVKSQWIKAPTDIAGVTTSPVWRQVWPAVAKQVLKILS